MTITESWYIWSTARASVFNSIIPLGSISITVDCSDQPDRVIEYNANNGAFDFKWDRRCGDGNPAPSGSYSVVLEACDIYHNCDEARGTVEIPFVALVPAASTPMPTVEKVEAVQWFQTPTPVPPYTSTPQAELVLPILPAIGGEDSGDEEMPTGSNQPLLPLTAAALGTSILLAASSRREEREAQAAARLTELQKNSEEKQAGEQAQREASVAAQTVATVNDETPYVEVSTLAALAGVVKETFTGVWQDAIRISPADAPTVHVYKNWVNGVDPIAYYEENGARLAAKAKFWQDYRIASQKKYYEEQRVKAIKEAEEKALKAILGEMARQDRETETAKNAAQNFVDNQERIKQENIAQAVRDELAEQQTKSQAHYAASIAAYQEQKRQEEKIAKENSKLTAMENATADKNVIEQHSYSDLTKAFREKEANAQDDIDDHNADQWQKEYDGFIVSSTMHSHYDQEETNYQSPFMTPINAEEVEPMPEWMAEMTLSMIPLVGDGVGVVRQLINKFTTGEMDDLDFTLSMIGLAMDLPFDAGIVGDTAIAVLKGFSAMIPIGAAREVLLAAVKQLTHNPESIVAMAGGVWKMMGSEDLVKLLTDNPKLLKTVLEGGGEYADELLEYGDDAVKLVDELGEEGVKELLESGAKIANKSNYRKLYLEEFSNLPQGWQVHHTLPQKYEAIMDAAKINIHDVEYLKGIDPKIHPKITNEWAKWEKALGHTPSAEEVISFSNTIDAKYGKYWFNK
ncbi:MAG: hypothetical protein JEZ00_21325 [Anaerolineaceae bacterium]|nr:hypothetical protein [Anaerolineaceae bacterium]